MFAIFLLSTIITIYISQDYDIKKTLKLYDNSYMDDIKIRHKKDGRDQWMLSAKKAAFMDSHEISLNDLKIIFPDRDLTLTSSYGIYNNKNRNLELKGDIEASTDKYNIKAKRFLWDSSKKELFSDQRVQIIGKGFFVEGDIFTATEGKARLDKNVKAVFNGK